MKYFVYAIRSRKDGRVYVGISADPERRLEEHNGGRAKSTKSFRPWYQIYAKELDSRVEARREEKKLKSGFGKEFLKSIV